MHFLKMDQYRFESCTIGIGMPENLRVHWLWPSKYKGKWCYSPKCVFSEMDHHTALKLVPLGSACLKTSGCTDFDPLNTKESDVIAQNVFSQKWIIIQLWNLYHWDQHAWKLRCADFDPPNTKESDVIAQNVFSQKWIIIQLWNLHHCNQHAWKLQGALSFTLQIQRKVTCYSPKCIFSEMDNTDLKLVPLGLACLKTSGCTDFDPLNTKEKWCYSPKCVFSENGSSYSFETCIPL